MIQFEYTSKIYKPVVTIDDLNAMGEQGWEFCFKRNQNDYDYGQLIESKEIVVFKRKKYSN
jgi:hypothetical protein